MCLLCSANLPRSQLLLEHTTSRHGSSFLVLTGRGHVHSAVSPAVELGGGCVLGPVLQVWSPGKGRTACTSLESKASLVGLAPLTPSHLPAGTQEAPRPPGSEPTPSARWPRAFCETLLRSHISRPADFFLSNPLSRAQCRLEGL